MTPADATGVLVLDPRGELELVSVDSVRDAAALLTTTGASKPVESQELLLAAVAAQVVGVVPGVDAVTVTLYGRNGPATVATTDPSTVALDEVQYGRSDGPCLLAIRTHTTTGVELRDDGRWPELTALAAERGIRTSLACPLFEPSDERSEPRAAMTLWGRDPDALVPVQTALIDVFTSAAAGIIRTTARWAQAEARARGLLTALRSRDLVTTAKGVVMARLGLDADEAFVWLTETSRRVDQRVRDLAALIVSNPDLVAAYAER